MSRPLLRSVLELRPCSSSSRITTTAAASFLLPRRCFNTTAPIVDAPPTDPFASLDSAAKPARVPKKQQYQRQQSSQQPHPPPPPKSKQQPQQSDVQQLPMTIPRRHTLRHQHPLVINPPRPGPAFGPPELPPAPAQRHPSVTALLPVLAAQPSRYITVHIYDRPYLVTAGDELRLPFLMHGVLPGDVLRLNRASVLGSRDYTLKGAPYIDERLYECRATVLGVESEPLRVKVKKKQRNRREKNVKSKHRYTMLRISEVKVVVPEDGEGEGEGEDKVEGAMGTDQVVRAARTTATTPSSTLTPVDLSAAAAAAAQARACMTVFQRN